MAEENLLSRILHAHHALMSVLIERIPHGQGDFPLGHARMDEPGQGVVQSLVVTGPGQTHLVQFPSGFDGPGPVQCRVPGHKVCTRQFGAQKLTHGPGQSRHFHGHLFTQWQTGLLEKARQLRIRFVFQNEGERGVQPGALQAFAAQQDRFPCHGHPQDPIGP